MSSLFSKKAMSVMGSIEFGASIGIDTSAKGCSSVKQAIQYYHIEKSWFFELDVTVLQEGV